MAWGQSATCSCLSHLQSRTSNFSFMSPSWWCSFRHYYNMIYYYLIHTWVKWHCPSLNRIKFLFSRFFNKPVWRSHLLSIPPSQVKGKINQINQDIRQRWTVYPQRSQNLLVPSTKASSPCLFKILKHWLSWIELIDIYIIHPLFNTWEHLK